MRFPTRCRKRDSLMGVEQYWISDCGAYRISYFEEGSRRYICVWARRVIARKKVLRAAQVFCARHEKSRKISEKPENSIPSKGKKAGERNAESQMFPVSDDFPAQENKADQENPGPSGPRRFK